MLLENPALSRALRTETLNCDLAIAGGGLAGTCAAITAARAGLKVVLVQDRPVLGGNASSEVRLWTLGATAHMGAPNRWAREGGVIDELLLENLWRNPEGNTLFFDALMLDKVVAEPNITLLLNTAVTTVEKSDADTIAGLSAFCSQNSTCYHVKAPLFMDASGDGIVGFMSGAAFRMGAESREEWGEKFAPDAAYGELLGHSLYFYSKDAGKPVRYVPPSFALNDVEGQIPRFRRFNTGDMGCKLWWIEYGGRLDTVHDTETIKWELWRVVYGVWDYIKNSGKFPDAANLTLEWVGHIPGKRESRRFEGDTWLKQQDVIEARPCQDAVAFGGWALDLHPADGVFSSQPGCTHWRMRGVYPIPYRCLYSRNINNLFLGGRLLSASHVAFGSARVMATLAHCGQAIALAAKLCRQHDLAPREVGARIGELQTLLGATGQHLPALALRDPQDLAQSAQIGASSVFRLESLPPSGPLVPLDKARGQMLPLQAGRVPRVTLWAEAQARGEVELQLRVSSKAHNHDFNEILARKTVLLEAGQTRLNFDFDLTLEDARYGLFCVQSAPGVSLRACEQRLSGVLSLHHAYTQDPGVGDARGEGVTHTSSHDIGVERFEVWVPSRRPGGHNFALEVAPPLAAFEPSNLTNGFQRPAHSANLWLAALEDPSATLTLTWPQPQRVSRVELFFDTDFDHPLESVLMGHPERAMPFCVRHFSVRAGERVLAEVADNFQTRRTLRFEALETTELQIELRQSWGEVPKALCEVRVYAE